MKKKIMKIGKGKEITELVKGSMQYTMDQMSGDFNDQFPMQGGEMGQSMTSYYIVDTFADYVVVGGYGPGCELEPDEYYRVNYTQDQGEYTFATQDQWEVVQLTYTPAIPAAVQERITLATHVAKVGEGGGMPPRRKGKRFEERINAKAVLEEAEAGKPRRVRFEKAMTADVVNLNNRRYPAPVLEAAIAELRDHLNEGSGQGRAIMVLGEAEHPSDKGGRPNLLETVVKWDEIAFDGANVDLTGRVLETGKGKDILTLMESDVMPGVSMRGYGDGKNIKGENIFEVTELHITGFDLVLEPSFENSASLLESQQGDDEMTIEELLKLLKDHPELFKDVTEAQVKKMGEEQLKAFEENVRKALGIDEKANIAEAMKALTNKAEKFDEAERKTSVEKVITEATKELPYGEKGNKLFVESVRSANPQDEAAVKSLVEGKRKEYDALFAATKIKEMGFSGRITSIAPVLEAELGIPEFARGAFMLSESIRKVALKARRDLREAKTPNEAFTALVLERFDQLYSRQLMAESQQLQEAETVSDLNLPYSVSRAIIEEAYPDLISAGIFDVGTINTSPTRLYFEKFAAESGYAGTVSSPESVICTLQDTWYAIAHGRLTPGAVVVKNTANNVTYVEGTDYVIDYAAGRIKTMGGTLTAPSTVHLTYTYTAIRDGEMDPIQRGKVQLSFKVIEAAADRLADQISREAVVFSASQMGYDVVARTIWNLARQIRRKIDQGMLYWAFSAVKSVANNSTDPWTVGTTQDDLDELVRLMGDAKVIVGKRFYTPTFFLMSITNSERLTNWRGFMRTGFDNAVLNQAGFAGRIKGMPIYAGTEFPDSLIIAGNTQLVAHRVLNPLTFKGPFPTYDSNGLLIAAEQYYGEEFNLTDSPIAEKGAFVPVEEASS
jgi:hypothetical protein